MSSISWAHVCLLDRKTESRGHLAVPLILARTLLCLRILLSRAEVDFTFVNYELGINLSFVISHSSFSRLKQ